MGSRPASVPALPVTRLTHARSELAWHFHMPLPPSSSHMHCTPCKHGPTWLLPAHTYLQEQGGSCLPAGWPGPPRRDSFRPPWSNSVQGQGSYPASRLLVSHAIPGRHHLPPLCDGLERNFPTYRTWDDRTLASQVEEPPRGTHGSSSPLPGRQAGGGRADRLAYVAVRKESCLPPPPHLPTSGLPPPAYMALPFMTSTCTP